MLDARDGTLLRTVRLGGEPSTVALDERRRTRVDALAGTLSVLDAASGTLRHTVRVDLTPNAAGPPYALAIDAGRDRVYLRSEVVVHSADWLAQGLQRLWAWLPWLGQVAPSPPNTRVLGSVSLIEAGA